MSVVRELLKIKKNSSPIQRLEILKNLTRQNKKDINFHKLIVFTYDIGNFSFNVKLNKKEKNEISKLIEKYKNKKATNLNTNNELKRVIIIVEFILRNVKSKKQFQSIVKTLIVPKLSKDEFELLTYILDRNLGVGYKQIVKEIKPILKNEKEIWNTLEQKIFKTKLLNYYPFSLANKLEEHNLIRKILERKNKSQIEKENTILKNTILLTQPKLDGFRASFSKDGKFIYTRNHERIQVTKKPYLQHLREQIQIFEELFHKLIKNGKDRLYKDLKEYLLENKPVVGKYLKITSTQKIDKEIMDYLLNKEFIFDGEIFFKDFQTTMSLSSKEKPKDMKEYLEYKNKLTYYIFDFIDSSIFENYEFQTDTINNLPQFVRTFVLNEFVKKSSSFENLKKTKKLNNIEIVPYDLFELPTIKNILEISSFYVSQGYEGGMIKFIEQPYIGDRGNHWLKKKFVNELECVIIDIEESKSENIKGAGAIIVKLPNGKICKVGSGLTEQLRLDLIQNKDKYIGLLVDIKFQELTKDGIPRFPVLLRIRKDKHRLFWNREQI